MEEINKEEIKKLMELKGEVKGVVFKTDAEYVLAEKGEKGLKKLEDELKNLDQPVKYGEIETFAYYPVGLRILSLLAIKKTFNLDDEKIENIGLAATKKSLILKFFIKYVFSLERIFFQESPKIWQKHWTVGEIVPTEMNEEKKYAILRLNDFNLHPIYCIYLKGYLRGLFSLMIKSPKITSQEVKCSFKGDAYHEYLIKWQ